MEKKTITINGKDYDIQLTGTVGLAILAQDLLRNAGITDASPAMKSQATFYAALMMSNEDKEIPSLMAFVAHWTNKELKDFSEWFDEQWRLLDPVEEESDEEDEKKA